MISLKLTELEGGYNNSRLKRHPVFLKNSGKNFRYFYNFIGEGGVIHEIKVAPNQKLHKDGDLNFSI